jgi:hypothetical protein
MIVVEREQAKRRPYEIWMAILVWGTPAVIALGLLYLVSVWVMHDPLVP